MGRKKIETPAICPLCKASFEHHGEKRFWVLKRHIETVHPDSGFTFNISKLEQYNATNIILANMKPEEIIRFMSPEFLAEIHRRLDEGEGDMGLFIFSRLRCDPKNPQNIQAVIPNLNKNQMKVKLGDEVITTTKKEGARMLADSLLENEVPIVQKEIGDICFDYAVGCDKRTREKRLEPGIIYKLENLSTDVRKNVNKNFSS
jgi:hypothetical protein